MICTDISKCALCLDYVLIRSVSYASCVHVMRDIASTIYKITKKIGSYIRRRQVLGLIDAFCDVTDEQLCDTGICAVCRVEFIRRSQSPQDRTNFRPTSPSRRASSFHEQARPKLLPCGHAFHRKCLQICCESRAICPLCRAPLGI